MSQLLRFCPDPVGTLIAVRPYRPQNLKRVSSLRFEHQRASSRSATRNDDLLMRQDNAASRAAVAIVRQITGFGAALFGNQQTFCDSRPLAFCIAIPGERRGCKAQTEYESANCKHIGTCHAPLLGCLYPGALMPAVRHGPPAKSDSSIVRPDRLSVTCLSGNGIDEAVAAPPEAPRRLSSRRSVFQTRAPVQARPE